MYRIGDCERHHFPAIQDHFLKPKKKNASVSGETLVTLTQNDLIGISKNILLWPFIK